MKKLLIGIFTFLIGFVSFSSAVFVFNNGSSYVPSGRTYHNSINSQVPVYVDGFVVVSRVSSFPDVFTDYITISGVNNLSVSSFDLNNGINSKYLISFDPVLVDSDNSISLTVLSDGFYNQIPGSSMFYYNKDYSLTGYGFPFLYYSDFSASNSRVFPFIGISFSFPSSSSEINVYYNNGSSTSISCDGENSIAINGLSTLYGDSTFVPFFNISYVDENNQKLIESYDKEVLYLDPGQFKKTYTGNNDWILSIQNQGGSTPDIIFTGDILPVEVTGSSDNVFSNFGDNALSVLYGNIPGFIVGGVILFLIFFIIRLFIPKNRR